MSYHSLLLLAYVFPIVLLAKQIAVPIDYAISGLGAPAALGGLLVAILILSPESMAAVRAPSLIGFKDQSTWRWELR